ncbi:2-oxoacid:acceptor oxidoreductase family protein [Candidatus Methylacidithermus pantelleriae]|nr:DUF6537 domain-containing protein [Candidatus Methylacidithermus pantelleriae]
MGRNGALARVDPRFLKEEGTEVFTGTELLVKGLLETHGGTHLWTGYPGSPVSGFFDAIDLVRDLLKERGIRAILANNEALAGAMLNGSQMMGLRAAAVMKSVGLHVASDGLALGNLAGAHPEGGALVIVGDDPWSESTQVPADSRFLAQHLHMPVLEPSSLQEVKDWINTAFVLSRESGCYILFLLSSYQAEGGGTVQLHHNHFDTRFSTLHPVEIDTERVDYDKVLLPPRTGKKEMELRQRWERLWRMARRLGVNEIFWPADPPFSPEHRYRIGFVSSGLSLCYLYQALEELGLESQLPILRCGISHPLDPELVREFASRVEAVVVVEERRAFLESQIACAVAQAGISCRIWGKQFPYGLPGFPDVLGLHPSLVAERLGRLLEAIGQHEDGYRDWVGLGSVAKKIQAMSTSGRNVVARTPTFCPGCPHRDSASVLLEIEKAFRDPSYMWKRHRKGPVRLVFHGDTGCYTMLMFEPYQRLMHNYSGMGLGGGTGLGVDPFITNKQVVFMGDSTFFHSGLVAISNSVKNGQDVTYLILDNRTTAMTGHQGTPATEEDLMGESRFTQRIETIARSITQQAGAPVIRIDPSDRRKYRQLLEEILLRDGVKVVIADKECAITYQRKVARREREEIARFGYLRQKRYIQINPEVCEYCLECTLSTGCPGLSIGESFFGPKIQTDLSWCVADGACAKLFACPAFEEITVIRRGRQPEPSGCRVGSRLPAPSTRLLDKRWSVYLAGVGGMGVASLTAVLVRAGHREGYRVRFCQKTGLAIRNGGVYSQVTFSPTDRSCAEPVLLRYGEADLLLGLDLLEAARALDPTFCQRVVSPERTAAIVNTAKTPTIRCLLGQEDFSVEELVEYLRGATRPGRFLAIDLFVATEQEFGTKLLANLVLLGVAFQRGELPLSLDSLQWAIRETFGHRAHENWQAFEFGRRLAEARPRAEASAKNGGYQEVLSEKLSWLEKRGSPGKKLAQALWRAVVESIGEFSLEDVVLRDLTLRLYELLLWGGEAYARRYLRVLLAVHRHDQPERGYEATQVAMESLFRVMAIKDEVYVAELLTRPERDQRDYDRYRLDLSQGESLVRRHYLCPEIQLLGRGWAIPLVVPHGILRVIARCQWLRKVLRWHRSEEAFRDYYLEAVETTLSQGAQDYDRWVAFLRVPLGVRGFRRVRSAQMEKAQVEVRQWLKRFRDDSKESLAMCSPS